jgi:hypothetical protein
MSKAQWEHDLSDSRRHFAHIVWPEIQHWFADDKQDVELLPTEGVNAPLHERFDTIAGVDFWIVDGGDRMVSLASRVQAQYDKTTYTVRYGRESGVDTEHQKRVRQYRDDTAHLPTYTLQGYVDATLGVLQNAAMLPTDQLYEYIITHRCPITDDDLIPSNERERFYAVNWDNLTQYDLRVYNWERAGLQADEQLTLSEVVGDD